MKERQVITNPFGCRCVMLEGMPVVALEITTVDGKDEVLHVFQEKGCQQLINALNRELKILKKANREFYKTKQ